MNNLRSLWTALLLRKFPRKLITRKVTNTNLYFKYLKVLPSNSLISNRDVNFSTCSSGPDVASYKEVKGICEGCDKDLLLIDVREPEELKETGILPNSINIPLGELEQVLKYTTSEEFVKKYGKEKPSKDFPIIFSCKSGKRSAAAQAISQQLGYTRVKNFLGGWTEWEEKLGCK